MNPDMLTTSTEEEAEPKRQSSAVGSINSHDTTPLIVPSPTTSTTLTTNRSNNNNGNNGNNNGDNMNNMNNMSTNSLNNMDLMTNENEDHHRLIKRKKKHFRYSAIKYNPNSINSSSKQHSNETDTYNRSNNNNTEQQFSHRQHHHHLQQQQQPTDHKNTKAFSSQNPIKQQQQKTQIVQQQQQQKSPSSFFTTKYDEGLWGSMLGDNNDNVDLNDNDDINNPLLSSSSSSSLSSPEKKQWLRQIKWKRVWKYLTILSSMSICLLLLSIICSLLINILFVRPIVQIGQIQVHKLPSMYGSPSSSSSASSHVTFSVSLDTFNHNWKRVWLENCTFGATITDVAKQVSYKLSQPIVLPGRTIDDADDGGGGGSSDEMKNINLKSSSLLVVGGRSGSGGTGGSGEFAATNSSRQVIRELGETRIRYMTTVDLSKESNYEVLSDVIRGSVFYHASKFYQWSFEGDCSVVNAVNYRWTIHVQRNQQYNLKKPTTKPS